MASITIRDLPDGAKQSLRVQAAQAGVSLETYARHILQTASSRSGGRSGNVLDLANKYFGDNGEDLDLPVRGSTRQPPVFH